MAFGGPWDCDPFGIRYLYPWSGLDARRARTRRCSDWTYPLDEAVIGADRWEYRVTYKDPSNARSSVPAMRADEV